MSLLDEAAIRLIAPSHKVDYIEKFMDHIDWKEVNSRYWAASA